MSDHHEDLPNFCHPVSIKLLMSVFVALIVLTILTVVVSASGKMLLIPPAFMFPIAMMFATAKAFLVCAFFMHMWWDKSFNVLAFFSSLFFVALFIGMTLMDTDHYSNNIDQFPRAAETSTAE